jgi:hypothetical protein
MAFNMTRGNENALVDKIMHCCPSAYKVLYLVTDVDECTAGLANCEHALGCHNYEGGYRCDCNSGMRYNVFSGACEGENERVFSLIAYSTTAFSLSRVSSRLGQFLHGSRRVHCTDRSEHHLLHVSLRISKIRRSTTLHR